jgi:hypothetical protein
VGCGVGGDAGNRNNPDLGVETPRPPVRMLVAKTAEKKRVRLV